MRKEYPATIRNSGGKFKTEVNSKSTLAYSSWHRMLQRCYNPEHLDARPTYQGCRVVSSWHDFQAFAQWYEDNYPTEIKLGKGIYSLDARGRRLQIDKDLLVPGNKTYGPENCIFVTHRLNCLFTDSGATRGVLPLGVSMSRTRFRAYCRNGDGKSIRKTFKTLDEAVDFYWATKFQVVFDAATETAEIDMSLAEKIIEYFFYFMGQHQCK